MNDLCTYHIQLRGQVDEGDVNATGPLLITAVQVGANKEYLHAGTLITVCTDQSGLVGLLRHLHGLGFVLVSVIRADRDESVIDQVRVKPRQ
jgi:hypothetical protein